MIPTNPFRLLGAALTGALLAGCASDMKTAEQAKPAAPAAQAMSAAPAKAAAAAPAAVMYFAVLPEDERYYLFGDTKNYFAYKEHGEVALTRTRIGASPKGTTVVFGVTNDDVKGNKPSAAEILFDGKAGATAPFYGEVFKDGRYYVFNDFADMKSFLDHGEVAYNFTDIGAGPNGASLVWVLNKNTIKQGRPEATIATFNALRSKK